VRVEVPSRTDGCAARDREEVARRRGGRRPRTACTPNGGGKRSSRRGRGPARRGSGAALRGPEADLGRRLPGAAPHSGADTTLHGRRGRGRSRAWGRAGSSRRRGSRRPGPGACAAANTGPTGCATRRWPPGGEESRARAVVPRRRGLGRERQTVGAMPRVLFVFHLGSSLDASGIPRQLSPAAGARIYSSADLGSRTVASGMHKRFPPAASFPLSKEFKCPSFRKSVACSPSSKILKCSGARISSSADLGSSTVVSGIHKRSPPAASFPLSKEFKCPSFRKSA
jgi:hypothetical protein